MDALHLNGFEDDSVLAISSLCPLHISCRNCHSETSIALAIRLDMSEFETAICRTSTCGNCEVSLSNYKET